MTDTQWLCVCATSWENLLDFQDETTAHRLTSSCQGSLSLSSIHLPANISRCFATNTCMSTSCKFNIILCNPINNHTDQKSDSLDLDSWQKPFIGRLFFRLHSSPFCCLCVTVFKIPVAAGNNSNLWASKLHAERGTVQESSKEQYKPKQASSFFILPGFSHFKSRTRFPFAN